MILPGAVPKEIMSIPSLTIYMGLSQNELTGSVPIEVGTLINLGTLDVSDNMLSGEIPGSLGSCIRLENLYLQDNFFQGTIPSSFSSLKGLQVLNLSHNNLTGNIPDFFKDFRTLLTLNLSFNDFEGMVPTDGVFQNSSAASLAGNSKLCGRIAAFQLPQCKGTKRGKLTLATKLVIAASGLICAALVLSAMFLLTVKRKKVEPTSSSTKNLLLQMSYHGLFKATDEFSSTNLLGVGSLKPECEALRNIRHRNLVKLLTACSGIDYRGNDFRALVYEFMVNRSLEEWLHPPLGINNEHESPRSLNFIQRLDIAIDVACALEYLHYGCKTPIVHCDLKPSNALLDKDMTGHAGDFGLARFFREAANNFSINQTSTIGVKGTIGYAAPEYGMGNEVSASGDVYSYGILLLEMFTGKRPTDEIFKDSLNLHGYVKAALLKQTEEVWDPILLQEIKEESRRFMRNCQVQECMISIFEIGVACSAELPRERMDMNDVTFELHAIKGKLLSNGTSRNMR